MEIEYESCIHFKTKNYEFTQAILNASIEKKLSMYSLCIAPASMASSFIIYINREESIKTLTKICSDYGIKLEV